MISLFQNILFSKKFLACNGCFVLFSKIKKGSWTRFWCTFSAWSFHKNVPYLTGFPKWGRLVGRGQFGQNVYKLHENYKISIFGVKTVRGTLGGQAKQVVPPLQVSLPLEKPCLKQWLIKRKRGDDRITKIQHLKNKKTFLDDIKSILFEGLSFGEKIKNRGHTL